MHNHNSPKPKIIFLSNDLSFANRLLPKLGEITCIGSSLKLVRDNFNLEFIGIDPKPKETVLSRITGKLAKMTTDLDLILVDIDSFPTSQTGGYGIELAMDLREHLTSHAIGVYTRFELRQIDRIKLSVAGFALLLERISDLFESPASLTGDEWCDVFSHAIARQSQMNRAANKSTTTGSTSIDSVVMRFEFPDEVKNACSRYLLYFLELLREFGIETSYELHERVGGVMFTVTPTNSTVTVEDLSAALQAYLYLPSIDVRSEETSGIHKQIVLRLISKVRELQSELAYAEAIISAQRKALNSEYSLSRGTVMLESLRDLNPKPNETQDAALLMGGFVEIRSIEYKGVAFKLGKLINYLKNLKQLRDANEE